MSIAIVDDATAGLVDNGARAFLPRLGIFTSPEPLHQETLGRGFYGPLAFTYGAQNPQRFVDPDGRWLDGLPERPGLPDCARLGVCGPSGDA